MDQWNCPWKVNKTTYFHFILTNNSSKIKKGKKSIYGHYAGVFVKVFDIPILINNELYLHDHTNTYSIAKAVFRNQN